MNKQTEKKVRTNDNSNSQFAETANCKELEREFADFFKYLNSVSDLEKQSLEQLLDTAIGEEEKFLAWKNSRRRLENVRLFYKTGGERVRVKQPAELSDFSRSVELAVDVDLNEIDENSQFEIWECDGRNVPDFPLHRIAIGRIFENGKLKVREPLRQDICLRIDAEMKENFISFKLSHEVAFYPAARNRLKSFVENERKIFRQVFQLGWLKEAFALANFVYLIFFLAVFVVQPATAMNMSVYSEEKIMKEECEKRICVARLYE